MNCTLLRFADEMIVVDAGMGFPEESVYGVDVCIPDFEILEQYAKRSLRSFSRMVMKIIWARCLTSSKDSMFPFTLRASRWA